MSQFALLGKRRFAPFFWTQALGAFNDSAFRNAMVMLAAFQMGLPERQVSLYTNLAPALFILPYFLFSATAGQLAEKFEKTRIIRYVKLFEIAAMLLAAWGFHTHQLALLLMVLFMMGVHSTVFGPIKYAILPQALKPTELVGGNGMVEMGTQLAILIGMIAGNALMLLAGVGPLASAALTIGVAALGYSASRAIPPAPATAPELKFNWNPFTETVRVLGITHRDRAVFNAVLGISWFWFFGTVLVAQLPVYTKLNLGGDGSVNTLVLTLFSLGTGIGSLLCEKMSGKRVEIGLVPLGGLAPRVERGVVGGRHPPIEDVPLEPVVALEPLPVEVGPAIRLEEVVALGHSLGPELGHEPHEPGDGAGQGRQLPLVTVVPAEVQVAIGAVELRRVGQDPRVGDDRAGGVGLLERPLHRAVEDGLVPAREGLRRQEPAHHGRHRLAPPGVDVEGQGLVVPAPDRDRRVVGEQVHRLPHLAHGLLPDAPGVAPLEREVLPQEHPRLVGRVVQLGAGDVGVEPDEVEVGLLGQGHVPAQLLGRGPGARRRDRKGGRAPLGSPDGHAPPGAGTRRRRR